MAPTPPTSCCIANPNQAERHSVMLGAPWVGSWGGHRGDAPCSMVLGPHLGAEPALTGGQKLRSHGGLCSHAGPGLRWFEGRVSWDCHTGSPFHSSWTAGLLLAYRAVSEWGHSESECSKSTKRKLKGFL